MIAWRKIAMVEPEFVQWVAQKYGPLPEMCDEKQYVRYAREFVGLKADDGPATLNG